MNILTGAKIKMFFPNHTMPCIKNFILLMETILQSRTVCLYKCRDKVQQICKDQDSHINSCYMRLIRFFKMKHITEFILGIQSLMISLRQADLTYLIVDRSNWKRGAKNFNLLTIGNLLSNVFVPLYWIQLDKRGNSNIDDRQALIKGLMKLLKQFNKTLKGSILLADREFIGQLWFTFLRARGIRRVIRIRADTVVDELRTEVWFKTVQTGQWHGLFQKGWV